MGRARVGVALLLPPPLDAAINGLREALGDPTLGRIPAHLTLVPPVNVRDDRMSDALRVLREAASGHPPLRVGLGPPATFLPDNPVLYLPVVKGADDVMRLRDAVFRDPLARTLTWPYVPHVTVADEAQAGRIAAAIEALSDYRAEATFERVHLLEEGPGRVWTPMADAALARPTVIGRGGLPIELSVTKMPDPEVLAFLDRDTFVITARDGGAAVGAAEGWTRDALAHLEQLAVREAERGRGIGSHLLAAFESLAAARGCLRLETPTPTDANTARFFQERGWTDDARRGRLRRDLA